MLWLCWVKLKPFTQQGQEKNEELTFFKDILYIFTNTDKKLVRHRNYQTKRDLRNRKKHGKRNGIYHLKMFKKINKGKNKWWVGGRGDKVIGKMFFPQYLWKLRC